MKFQRNGSGTVIESGGVPAESGRLVASYVDHAKGRVTKTTDPTGATAETTYNSIGQVATTTDRYNATTTPFYNRAGERVGTRYPDNTVSYQATYYADDGAGRPMRCSVSEDRHLPGQTVTGTRTFADAAGHAIRSERVTDLVINLTLDSEIACDTAYGSCTAVTRTLTEYLQDGRVLKTAQDLQLDGTISAGDPVTLYEYSGDGLLKTTHLPAVGNVTTDVITISDLNGNILTNQTRSYVGGALQTHHPATASVYDQLNRQTESWAYSDIDANDGVLMQKTKYDWCGRAGLR